MIQVTLECEHWEQPARLAPGAAVLIGRDARIADLPIPVSGVSKQHCEVAVSQTGAVIRDLGSTNGTFVNGRWASESALHDGDVVELGPKVTLTVAVVREDGPLRCDACGGELTGRAAARGGRYRDTFGHVFCLSCALKGAGDFTAFGRYRLLHAVGSGLSGRVFEAHDTNSNRRVALKVLNPGFGDDDKQARTTQRFHREIDLMQALQHPAIVEFHDAGEVRGQHYLAMEFVDGADLGAVLEQTGGPLPLEEVTRVVETVAAALEWAHGQGVVHRDVKPGNILRDETTGSYKVTDFGLARRTDSESLLTAAGSIVGTLEFMAPEQLENAASIDGRADVYGLAATAFYLLTAERPFTGANDYQLMMAVMNAPVPDLASVWPEAPKGLAALLRRGMERDPDQRLASPAELWRGWQAAVSAG